MIINLTEQLAKKYANLNLDDIADLFARPLLEEQLKHYFSIKHTLSHPCEVQEGASSALMHARAKEHGLYPRELVSALLVNAKGNGQKLNETWYQLKLQEALGGSREVRLDCGYLDLLVDRRAIEVKFAKNYKHSLGQILTYCDELGKGYLPCLALIGERDHNIERILFRANVHTIFWIEADKHRDLSMLEIVNYQYEVNNR